MAKSSEPSRTNACFHCGKVFVVPKDYDWYCSSKCLKLYWKAYKLTPRKKELRPVKKRGTRG